MRPAELRQQLDIETPEHAAVRLELAGVGSRAAAALVDTLIVVVLLVLLQFAGGATGLWHLGAGLVGWVLAVVILLSFLTFFGYFALFEALNGGRTPGKQAVGIRVVMATGHAVTPTAAIVRFWPGTEAPQPNAPFLKRAKAIALSTGVEPWMRVTAPSFPSCFSTATLTAAGGPSR